MKTVNVITATSSAALLTAALATGAWAQPWNEKTFLTFSAPIEIPGKTLPAGTYTFKLADSLSNRHIVQVFNKDESQIFATILAIPSQRRQVTEDTVITFMETPVGTPAAIRYWYYPGDKIGHEFIYPKDQAMRIARASNQTVLATETTSTDAEEMKAGKVITVSPTGDVADADTRDADVAARTEPAPAAQSPAPAPAPEPRATTPMQDPAPSAADRRVADDRDADRLPQTASALPLVTLIGFASIGGAAALRRLRRRRA